MPDAEWDAALSWLRAQMDEEERVALAATPSPWRWVRAFRSVLDSVVPEVEGMESQIEGEWGTPEFRNGPDGTAVRVREPYPSVAHDLVRYVAAPFAELPDFPEVLRLEGVTT